jgi:hypothetical protein
MTKKISNFVEEHRPRHPLEEAMKKDQGESVFGSQLMGHFVRTEDLPESTNKKTLFDVYGSPRLIFDDVGRRPNHYTERQREIARALMSKQPLDPPPTDNEKNELLLTYMRKTQQDRTRRDIISRVSGRFVGAVDEPIILPDGRTLDESVQHERMAPSVGPSSDDIIII